jgi:hypothetical protein
MRRAMQQPDGLGAELVGQLQERPYLTLASLVGVGWILGRGVPLRALFAIAGVGARAAVATAVERSVRDHLRGTAPR